MAYAIPTPHSATFLLLLERLRVPLSQQQKRHLPPERYVQYVLNICIVLIRNK
jgi:hypothetical protein